MTRVDRMGADHMERGVYERLIKFWDVIGNDIEEFQCVW